jgi:hypothetical protein
MDLPAKHVRPTAQLCGVKDEPEDRPVPLPNGHALAPRDPELYARYWLLQHQAIEWWMAPMHISKWVQARIEHQAEVEWVASWAGGNPPAEPDFTALEESRTAHYPARHHEVQWSDLGAIRSVVEDRAAAYGYEEKPPPPRW